MKSPHITTPDGKATAKPSDTPETDAATLRAIDIEGGGEFDAVHVQVSKRLERERNEWHYNAMLRLAVEMLSCMWCGELVHAPKGFVPGSPLTKEQRAQAYREHVSTCKKHPIREAEKLVRRLLNYADKIGPKNPTIAGQTARRDAGMWLARISPGNETSPPDDVWNSASRYRLDKQEPFRSKSVTRCGELPPGTGEAATHSA